MAYNYSSNTARYSIQLKPKDNQMPIDTVSCIVWDTYKSEPMFATGSWDGFIRIYIVNNNEVNKVWETFLHHPVLCVDFNQNGIIFAGLASGDVVAVELQSCNMMGLGSHDAPICGIYWLRKEGCLMTLGFDNVIKLWALQPNNACQMEYKLPLKTVTCSLDYPLLLIGSVETTISIISLKDVQHLNIPKTPQDYIKSTLERFSKFVSCRIITNNNTASMGTIDGRVLAFGFKQSYGKYEISQAYVTRVMKRMDKGNNLFGQVNSIDIGYYNYESFSIIAGTEEIAIFNTLKKSKVKALTTNSSTTGAGTAVKISPKNEYIAYATGSDWVKGLYELESIKKPKIGVVKLTNSDLSEYVCK